jgi:phosphoribosyl 1,2-cyclic phosphodiesterase
MSLRFTVLASGSRGNASLVQVGGFRLLLDAGLGPRQLAGRLAAVGVDRQQLNALLLTHTHGDHWNDRTLHGLLRHRIPLYCHPDHADTLARCGSSFPHLAAAGLVRFYDPAAAWELTPGLHCRPLPVRHDSGATFGFRFDGPPDLFGHRWALGYVSDLGCWTPALAAALADVDALALEFNHDVELERASGRSRALIERVLGDEGHLSNDQAASLLREVLTRSVAGRLRHLVQLHLSQDCNRPELATQAAQAILTDWPNPPAIHTARQHRPGPTIRLGSPGGRPRPRRATRTLAPTAAWLPGLDG